MSGRDRAHWDQVHSDRAREPAPPPAAFLVENAPLLVAGRTLDLAAGSGRNSAFLASMGHRVLAVDVSREALQTLRRRAPAIDVAQVDLDRPCFRPASFDNVVCIDFLDRRLFPEMLRWIRPGGVLLLDTFLIDQRTVGHPRNPAFLLERGELLERLHGERVLRHREGPVRVDSQTSFRAGIVAVMGRPQN
jgi:SAM-dependent methyltransferase